MELTKRRERWRACISQEHVDYRVRVFSKLLSGTVGRITRHHGRRYRNGDGNPRRGYATVPLRVLFMSVFGGAFQQRGAIKRRCGRFCFSRFRKRKKLG